MRTRFSNGWLQAVLMSMAMLLLAVGAVGSFDLYSQATVHAQEFQEQPAANNQQPPPANNQQPAAEQPKKGQSRLAWIYTSCGPMFFFTFLGISFAFVALIVMNILTARRENVLPMGLVEAFEAHLNEKRYQEAYELAKNDESMLGQVLSAGLAKLSSGYEKAIAAMQEVGEDENMKMEHRLSYIGLIGAVSTMVGLLGTVYGMVQSFDVLAVSGGAAPKPEKLAEGVSQALVTTLIGLFIAIPAIAIYTILKNRLSRLVFEVGMIGEGLMSRFEGVGLKK
jgi:biopolymer transport protein ExbB